MSASKAERIKFMNRVLIDRKRGDQPTFESNPPTDFPLIVIGRATSGSWFGIVTCLTHGANLQVHRRPTLRAAKDALAKRIRGLRDELARLK